MTAFLFSVGERTVYVCTRISCFMPAPAPASSKYRISPLCTRTLIHLRHRRGYRMSAVPRALCFMYFPWRAGRSSSAPAPSCIVFAERPAGTRKNSPTIVVSCEYTNTVKRGCTFPEGWISIAPKKKKKKCLNFHRLLCFGIFCIHEVCE